MPKSVYFIALVLTMGVTMALGQTGLFYSVKIKPGNSVKASPNNEHSFISSGKEILMVSNATGQVLYTFAGHSGAVTDIDINQDGSLMLTAATDNSLIIWDLNTSTLKRRLHGHSKSVLGGKFAGSSRVASIGKDNTIKIWDVATGELLHSYEHTGKKLQALATSESMVAVGAANKITIYNSIDGSITSDFMVGTSDITALSFGLKSHKLISASEDGTLNVWSLKDKKLLVARDNGKGRINNIEVARDNLHFVVAGSSCNIYALENLALLKEIDKVTSTVLDASFTPDGRHVLFIEEFVPNARYWSISELNLTHVVTLTDDADKNAPQIYIATPAKIIDNRVIHYEDLLKIQGSVIDDYGVKSLKINGIKTPVAQNGGFIINLPLSGGDNFVTIEAADVNNNISVKKFIVSKKSLDGVAAYDGAEAKNYLLVIGINKYSHWPQLFNAVKDANDVVNTLLGAYNFQYSDVTLITDEQATRSNIYKTLRSYVNLVGPNDNFMIYYSGHGHFDGVLNEGYWVPVDARVNNNGDYLSNSDISKIIGNINSQHTFLVADACFSGSLFNEQTRGYAENVEKYRSRWGLASGRLETVSDGQSGGNSPFTKNFIQYLKNNQKDKVAVSEIVQYVKLQVSEVSDQTPIGNPLRGVGDEGGEFIFYKKQ